MVISYQGENYFKIQSGDQIVLVDPENQRSFRGATLVLYTEKNNFSEKNSECFLIGHPGEYEVGGIHVRGFNAGSENGNQKTVFQIEFDEIKIAILGKLTKEPEQELQEFFEESDIVIAPAGGKPYVSQNSIAKFIRQIEPGIIIPSLFKDLKPFLGEFGQKTFACEEKIVFKKKDIEKGNMKIVCLKSD